MADVYVADDSRYDKMKYNRVGNSGLKFPAVSLGLWHNFGSKDNYDNMKAMLRTAFNNGITQFDLANNYGPVYGSAEANAGRLLAEDFKPYRDELVITTKAGLICGRVRTVTTEAVNILWQVSTRALRDWALIMWIFLPSQDGYGDTA